jgi:hypothetical protein
MKKCYFSTLLVHPTSDVLNDEGGGLHGDVRTDVASGARSSGGSLDSCFGESSSESSTLSLEVSTGSLLGSKSSSVSSGLFGVCTFSQKFCERGHAWRFSRGNLCLLLFLGSIKFGDFYGVGTLGGSGSVTSSDSHSMGVGTLGGSGSVTSSDSHSMGVGTLGGSGSVTSSSSHSMGVGTFSGSGFVGTGTSSGSQSMSVGTLFSHLNFPGFVRCQLDFVPFFPHELLSVLHELGELFGFNAVIHGAQTSTRASGNGLVRVVRVSLSFGTCMGSSSGETDESLFAVVGGIAISLAHTKLVLRGPALGDKFGGFLNSSSGNGGNGDEGNNEGSHVYNVINNYKLNQ